MQVNTLWVFFAIKQTNKKRISVLKYCGDNVKFDLFIPKSQLEWTYLKPELGRLSFPVQIKYDFVAAYFT